MVLSRHGFTERGVERRKKRLVCFKYLELEEGRTIQVGRDCQRLGLLLPREVWGINTKQTED